MSQSDVYIRSLHTWGQDVVGWAIREVTFLAAVIAMFFNLAVCTHRSVKKWSLKRPSFTAFAASSAENGNLSVPETVCSRLTKRVASSLENSTLFNYHHVSAFAWVT